MDPYQQYLADVEYHKYLNDVQGGGSAPQPQTNQQDSGPNWMGGVQDLAGGLGDIMNGITLGHGNDVVGTGVGLTNYGLDAWNGVLGGKSLNDYISSGMDQTAAVRSQYGKDHPIASPLVQAAGLINNPISLESLVGEGTIPAAISDTFGVSKPISSVVNSALEGMTQGAVYGSGERGNRLGGAAQGALDMGAIGAGLGATGEALGALPLGEWGQKLQRASMGIRQSDVKAAAKDVGPGMDNPLITAFDNLQNEGLFKGDKSPIALEEKLANRAAPLNTTLDNALTTADQIIPPNPSPLFTKTDNLIAGLRGTDKEAAQAIADTEKAALQRTLEQGGSLEDWQASKRSIQSNTKYGTDSASLQNDVRQAIASDLKTHIENTTDAAAPPELAGTVKETNQALSQGLRFGKIVQRDKNADLARDPIEWAKAQMRTSGGFGVPILMAGLSGGGEYERSGSIPRALIAGATGMALGTRAGKYNLGSVMKLAPEVIAATPALVTRATTPFFVKNITKQAAAQRVGPPAPIDYFKAGAKGVSTLKAMAGSDPQALDSLYAEATSNFKDYAAPNGTIDPSKAQKWMANNQEAINSLPELKAQLINPNTAQKLIDKHFQNGAPVPQDQVELNALKELVPIEPMSLIDQALKTKNPINDLRQTMAYLKQDPEARNGFRRATTNYLNQFPEAYPMARDTLEKGNVFTTSQIKVADALYGYKDPAAQATPDSSTLKAILQMKSDNFLGSPITSPYLDKLEPLVKSVSPEQFRAKLEHALADPAIARDLMNKANVNNVTRSLTTLFNPEIQQVLGPQTPPPAPPPTKIQPLNQQKVTATTTFPTPDALKAQAAPGSVQKTSFDLSAYPAETRARVGVESSGNPWAVSPKGAQGLSQLMPDTAQDVAKALHETYMPLRPGMTPQEQAASMDQNIRFGNYYLKTMLPKIDPALKDPSLAWAAYNAGPGRVQEAMKLAGTSRDVNKILSELPKGVKAETIPYIDKIVKRLT